MAQPGGDSLEKDAVPPVPVHDVRDGNYQRQIGALAVQSPDVVDQGRHEGPMR